MYSTTSIFIIILFAALCHAAWSSIVKSKNSLGIMALTSIIEIIFFTPLVFYVPFPPLEIWYFIIASVILHGFYRLSVVYSYKFGDLSFVYPISRGSSSLIIAILTIFFLNEKISLIGLIAIIIVCIGIFFVSYKKSFNFNLPAFLLALSTALLIAIYTLVDGYGIRLSNNEYSYLYWMLLLNGIPILIFSIYSDDISLKEFNLKFIGWGMLAGILAILSYGIVVWSMQYLTIAYVSSIRESSIIFATLIGLLILKEKQAKNRLIPALIIVVGISILYFQI
tara:strand:- start:292 stop:1134 length:843 start_codon:yes stop_codon:yes gene_type:complete